MPRNGSGTYTLPEAAFVSGTVISSTAVNSDFSDIGNAITDSLARDGQGGMTDTLPLSSTGFIYSIDPNTGMYRTGADAQAIRCGGADIVDITASGIGVTGDVDATGSVKQNGAVLLPIGLGPLPWSLSAAPPLWALCYGQPCTPAYAAYRALLISAGSPFGNNGTDPLFPDARSNLLYGKGNMGGTDSGRLTTAYFGADPTTLGAQGGAQNTTFLQANLPNVSLPVIVNDARVWKIRSSNSNLGSDTTVVVASNTGVFNNQPVVDVTGSLSVSVSTGGSGTPISRLGPGLIVNYIVFVGV